MALSRRFSSVVVNLLFGLDFFTPSFLSSSVIVMRIAGPPPVTSLRPSDREYLLSLLRIGEGLTRKSRSEAIMALARQGNFTAILPKACTREFVFQAKHLRLFINLTQKNVYLLVIKLSGQMHSRLLF